MTSRDVDEFGMDVAHVERLSPAQRYEIEEEAEDFLVSMRRNFSQLYLHLDVDEHKETKRGKSRYYWKALLITDNGRYHAEDGDFGAVQALSRTLANLEGEVHSRLGRLEDVRIRNELLG